MNRLILVRHGETTGQSSIRLNGNTDVPLSEQGRAQMRKVKERIDRAFHLDRVLCSPLQRARETASIVAPSLPPVVIDGFRELHFGRWETLTYAEVAAREPELSNEMQRGKLDFCFPEGESRIGFFTRVRHAAMEHLVDKDLGGVTLVAAHKGTIKAITGVITEGYDWERARAEACELGSVHLFERSPGARQWRRTLHNAVDHLEELRMPE